MGLFCIKGSFSVHVYKHALTSISRQVDATDDKSKDVASKFGVRGYPTLKIFRDGDIVNPVDYEGPREAAGIVKHVKKISGPASTVLETAEEVAFFKDVEDVPVFVYFEAAEGDVFDAYSKKANKLRNDYSFAHVTDASLLKVAAVELSLYF